MRRMATSGPRKRGTFRTMFAAPPCTGLGKLEEGKRPSLQWLEWQRVRQSKRGTSPREHQFWALPLEPLGAPPAQSSSTRLSVLPSSTGNRRIRRQRRARRSSPVQRNSPDPLLRVRLPGLRARQVVDEGGSESVNTEVHRPLSTAEDSGRPVYGLSPVFPHEQHAQAASTHAETLDVEKLRKIGNETARGPGSRPGSGRSGSGDGQENGAGDLVVPEDDDDFVDVDDADMAEQAAATGASWVWGGSRPPRALSPEALRDATYRRAEPSLPRPWASSESLGEGAPAPARDDLLELEELEESAATAPTSALAPLAPPSKFVTGTKRLPRVATLHARGVTLRDRGPGFAGKSDVDFLRASRASSAALAATLSPPAGGEGRSPPRSRSPAAGGRERKEQATSADRGAAPVPWTMDRLDRRLRELEWFKYLGPEDGVGPDAGKAKGGQSDGTSRPASRPRRSSRGSTAQRSAGESRVSGGQGDEATEIEAASSIAKVEEARAKDNAQVGERKMCRSLYGKKRGYGGHERKQTGHERRRAFLYRQYNRDLIDRPNAESKGPKAAETKEYGRLARLERRRRQRAAVLLQAGVRGVLARKHARHARKGHAAAVAVQRITRGWIARGYVDWRFEMRDAATDIQRRWRGVLARRRAADLLLAACASRIQGAFRGHLSRRWVRELMRQFRSARRIQCAWRQRVAKRRVAARRRHWRAATRIQAKWRCILGMRFAAWYKRRHLAALRIQRLYRGVATWKAALAGVQQTLASIKLQRVARGFLQRLRLFTQLRATAVESSTPIPLIPGGARGRFGWYITRNGLLMLGVVRPRPAGLAADVKRVIHSVPWRQRAAALAQANSAARALQRGTRGFTSRRRVRKLLLRSGACRVLQPALRGFMARRKLLLWEASQGRPSLPALSPLPDARQVGGSGWRYRRLAVWYFFVHWEDPTKWDLVIGPLLRCSLRRLRAAAAAEGTLAAVPPTRQGGDGLYVDDRGVLMRWAVERDLYNRYPPEWIQLPLVELDEMLEEEEEESDA